MDPDEQLELARAILNSRLGTPVLLSPNVSEGEVDDSIDSLADISDSSLGSSDQELEDDEEDEDGQEDPFNNNVILQMYSELYKKIDKMKELVQNEKNDFQNNKRKYYSDNFDRTTARPLPIGVVMNRYNVIIPMFDNILRTIAKHKHHVKYLDRTDEDLFFPRNRRIFREKTYATLVKPKRKLPIAASDNTSVCVSCQGPACVAIHRHCIWCEGQACSHKDFILCERCSIHWYWQSSNKYTKSFATCPMCRSEYCLEDIVTYEFDETAISSQTELENLKRKYDELNQEHSDCKRTKLDVNSEQTSQ